MSRPKGSRCAGVRCATAVRVAGRVVMASSGLVGDTTRVRRLEVFCGKFTSAERAPSAEAKYGQTGVWCSNTANQ